MSSEKCVKDVFSTVNIQGAPANGRVRSLNIDTENRGIRLELLMGRAVPYEEIIRLKSALIKAYALNKIEIRTAFDNFDAEGNMELCKDYITGELADASPIYKYVFAGSVWKAAGGRLEITVSRGCTELLQGDRAAERIQKILKRWGAEVCVVFSESTEEPRFEEEIPPVPVYTPRERDAAKTEKKEMPVFYLGKDISGEAMDIRDVRADSGRVIVEGELFFIDSREIGRGKVLVVFYLSDKTGSVICKFFTRKESYENIKEDFTKGIYIKVRGDAEFDRFENDVTITAKDINNAVRPKKTDNAKVKRVELHAHTKMSSMDAVASVRELVKTAKQYGHRAVAITDHGVVQAFPEALSEKDDTIKILYGMEAYFVNDCDTVIYRGGEYPIDGELVVFDVETTGLSPKTEEITEIGAVRICAGEVVDSFSTFVNPGKPIPPKIVELTGITDEMVSGAPAPTEAVKAFLEFCNEVPLIAHNAEFDMGFIREALRREGDKREIFYLDTLELCRSLVTEKKRHKLDIMAEFFGIPNPAHHRAVNDAQVCAAVWDKCARMLKEKGIASLDEIDKALSGAKDLASLKSHHAVIFAKNRVGLQNLYTLVSMSHLNYYKRTPRIPKSEFIKHREGLIIGSACEAGELFRAVKAGADETVIKSLCEFYDYFEIQPIGNNMFMVRNNEVSGEEELRELNRKIVALGKRFGKPVVATGDVHFLQPEDEVFRRILMAAKKFADADNQAPMFFRTTAEMLREFEYLGEAEAREVVIENTNKVADMIEDISPLSHEKCPPVIDGSAEDIEKMCYEKALRIYGNPLPELVEARMKRELESIIKNGFAVMYMIAHKLVKKSLEDGYLVGSRGSVGSSFAAFLADVTEVNSLPPHYICPKCKYSRFITDGSVGSGCDMPDENCPECKSPMKKDGHDIPFETFLGFKGDKAPDIDLNFSGDYQALAHKYTETLFGEGNIFRAGTIGTVAEKTAYGFIKSYHEERGQSTGKAETERLIAGCTGVKRTTGQHPGGIIVLPKGRDIHEFTPIQRPADKDGTDIITTHFDYHSIENNLLKLDLLGHDDPTVIKMLEDLTGVSALEIPLDDKETMSIFLSTKALGVRPEEIGSEVGTYGVPEFGTKFVRQMLMDTKPKSFSDLIRISGLSHGTDVWTNNAQELVRSGLCTLSSCICTRDDIMIYLMHMGLEPSSAFSIMEAVRKGNGLKPEWEDEMREKSVPRWYIDSCNKIKYMFPKAHACAYVTMAFRIAWFKVHYPLQFYLAYFSIRADTFEYDLMCMGAEKVKSAMGAIQQKGSEALPKDKAMIPVLEICVEMYARGIGFSPVDLYKSDAERFLEDEGKIRPPLSSLPGVGAAAARSIASARENGEFLAVDDMIKRAGITKTAVEALKAAGCLREMPESAQITMF